MTIQQPISADFIGKYCIVRTYSAGVFAGTIDRIEGKQALLRDARRLWYWAGAASLSELSVSGTFMPKSCKFPAEVSSVFLTEVIVVLPCTPKAQASIAAVEEWTAA